MKLLNCTESLEATGGAVSTGSRPVICGPIEIPKSNQTYYKQ